MESFCCPHLILVFTPLFTPSLFTAWFYCHLSCHLHFCHPVSVVTSLVTNSLVTLILLLTSLLTNKLLTIILLRTSLRSKSLRSLFSVNQAVNRASVNQKNIACFAAYYLAHYFLRTKKRAVLLRNSVRSNVLRSLCPHPVLVFTPSLFTPWFFCHLPCHLVVCHSIFSGKFTGKLQFGKHHFTGNQ